MDNKTMRGKDLTGMRFGELTVVGPAESSKGKAMWRCKCACGRDVVVRADHLKSGHTTSCGLHGRPGSRARAAAGTEA